MLSTLGLSANIGIFVVLCLIGHVMFNQGPYLPGQSPWHGGIRLLHLRMV